MKLGFNGLVIFSLLLISVTGRDYLGNARVACDPERNIGVHLATLKPKPPSPSTATTLQRPPQPVSNVLNGQPSIGKGTPLQRNQTGTFPQASRTRVIAKSSPQNQTKIHSTNGSIKSLWVIRLNGSIPVIGSDKSTVELITAYLLRDHTALERICKEMGIYRSIFGNYTSLSFTQLAKEASTSSKNTGNSGNNRNDRVENLVSILTSSSKSAGRTAVSEAFKTLFEEAEKVTPTQNRADRGEHIINNGVLNLPRDILREFWSKLGNNLPAFNNVEALLRRNYVVVEEFLNQFKDPVSNDIQQVLIVRIPTTTKYINANAILYGRSMEYLKNIAVNHMLDIHDPKRSQAPNQVQGTRFTAGLKYMIDFIVKGSKDAKVPEPLFIDDSALTIWLESGTNSENNRKMFDKTNTPLPNLDIKGNSKVDRFQRAKAVTTQMFKSLYERLGYVARAIRQYNML